ncbi:MAG: exodeoxyribonuclease VII large subunit [Alphaproteobacteria bacterium]|jgi:exodeoxyribonuclease VII large subunit
MAEPLFPPNGPSDASSNAPGPGPNLPVFTVTEIAGAIKRAIEDNFGRVRVRGEISGLRRPGSGHLYLDLKDVDSIIATVCWKGVAGRLSVRPEDGMEVIVTGRITTYGPQSRYQLIVEDIELAGEGALLKLIEERKKKLEREGLFDEDRKQKLPFLPSVIGVVTSPTGAVIRDILHRLADRFPRHVVIWPVRVQGKGAAEEVAAGIDGFNALVPGGPIARPDLIIVARGGGSLEDLMAFNEEVVVRAAAASTIPLISAVGHETDVTLIDFAADVRAPTPTAAAEMAVPVRMDLMAQVRDDSARLTAAMTRSLADARSALGQLWRIAGNPRRLVEEATQKLDDRTERLGQAGGALIAARRAALGQAAAGLSPRALQLTITHGRERAQAAARGLAREGGRTMQEAEGRLTQLAALLTSYSYENVLARGFAVVRGADGRAIMAAADTHPGMDVAIGFKDGTLPAVIGTGGTGTSKPKSMPKTKTKVKTQKGAIKGDGSQGRLL